MMKKAIVSIVLVLSVVLFSNCSYAEEKGLVGLWKFDEGKGDIAKDAANNKNNGKVYGATWTQGKLGKALKFDGVDDYVNCGKDSSLNFGTGDFSISVWIKSNDEGQRCAFVGKKYYEGSAYTGYGLGYLGGRWRFQANDGTVNALYFKGPMGSGWRHVVGVRTSTDRYLYLDGVLVRSDGNGGLDCDIHHNLFIGASDRTFAEFPFNGVIDEVRIYSRALSSTEVDNLCKNKAFADKGQQKETRISSPVSDKSGIMVVKGKMHAKKKYPVGKMQFLDITLADQLVHIGKGIDLPSLTRKYSHAQIKFHEIPLRLSIKYKVLKTAPVIVNTNFGSMYWTTWNYTNHISTPFYTREDMDLANKGTFVSSVSKAVVADYRGPSFSKGLCQLIGRGNFMIYPKKKGKLSPPYLDWVALPASFFTPELYSKMYFTLANLSDFKLSFDEIQSTWKPGGPLRVKLNVTDADGLVLPVINVPAAVSAGKWQAPLTTQIDCLHKLTGWMVCSLPVGHVPEQLTVRATVSIMTPKGPTRREVVGTFRRRGKGQATTVAMGAAMPPETELPRNEAEQVRETRALWVSAGGTLTHKAIRDLVDKSVAARLNVLMPNIYSRGRLRAKSSLASKAKWLNSVEEGKFDPLAELIKAAHAKGLEVHPWFCVVHSGSKKPPDPAIAAVGANGKFYRNIACLHSLEYQDFFVNLVVDIARNYDINGIHLDYIRQRSFCYCDRCRKEFKKQFGKPLVNGTREDWTVWNQAAVGNIVQRVVEGVKKVKPAAIVSAALKGLTTGERQGQDPGEWARRGWLDVAIPMLYSSSTSSVRRSEDAYLHILDDDKKLVSGLCLYQRKNKKVGPRSPWLVKEQIQLTRHLGIHGYCLFNDSFLSPEIIEMLKTDINKEKAVPYYR